MKWNRTLTIEELAYMYLLQCPHCKKDVPNHDFFTENVKCLWCDANFHLKEKEKKNE